MFPGNGQASFIRKKERIQLFFKDFSGGMPNFRQNPAGKIGQLYFRFSFGSPCFSFRENGIMKVETSGSGRNLEKTIRVKRGTANVCSEQ